MDIRTRFAPSPTGSLHIGGIRTALYCYAWAKKNNGKFIVRIEDTDQTRFVEGATEEVFEMLNAYGLNPDESINNGGDHGPYIQSQRKDIYLKYAEELIKKGYAYYCFLEPEELKILQEATRGTGFRSKYRDQDIETSKKMVDEGKPYVIRLKVPENETIIYKDGVQGSIKFDTNLVNDEILIKSNGFGSYHLAVVVDDHLMKVSHVFRAVEWLPSTPKQIRLYRYLGWEMPPFYHVSAILDPSGGKLSKRKGSVSAKGFLQDGYLPEAMLNFLMLLGWSSPEKREFGEKEREIYSLEEFVKLFDVKDFNKSNPVFNREKLTWFNKEYFKIKTNAELKESFINWFKEYSEDIDLSNYILQDYDLEEKIGLVKERATTLKEILEQIKFFYKSPKDIDWNIKQTQNTIEIIDELKKEFFEMFTSFADNSKEWKHEDWEPRMRAIGDKYSRKHGDIFMVLRMAIVGSPFSPPLFESMQLLGKNEVLKRLTA